MVETCAVCTRQLPTLTVDQLVAGGRPRRTCSRGCKYRRDKRLRTLARLERWRSRAAHCGNDVLAAELAKRIETIRGAPFTVAIIASMSTAYRLNQKQQQARAPRTTRHS
jgi:hypothetical protein